MDISQGYQTSMNNRPTKDAVEECEDAREDTEARPVPVGGESYIVGVDEGSGANGKRDQGRTASPCWSVIHVRLM